MKRVARFGIDDLIGEGCDRTVAEQAIIPRTEVLREKQSAAEGLIADSVGVEPIWVALHWDNPQALAKEVAIADGPAAPLERFTELSEIFSINGDPRSRPGVSVFVCPPENSNEFSLEERGLIRAASVKALYEIGADGKRPSPKDGEWAR
jgi:hypothetical protein